MPIKGEGYEFHIVRTATQKGKVGAVTRTRTVGTYQVFHDGKAIAGLSGAMAEQKGPGDNTKQGNEFDRRVAAGRYALATQDGAKYKTIKYKKTGAALTALSVKPQPGLELLKTGNRSEILIHPAVGFLSSEGCLHPSGPLPAGSSRINFIDSRARVIAIIDDLTTFAGGGWPGVDGKPIPNAFVVIDGEP